MAVHLYEHLEDVDVDGTIDEVVARGERYARCEVSRILSSLSSSFFYPSLGLSRFSLVRSQLCLCVESVLDKMDKINRLKCAFVFVFCIEC